MNRLILILLTLVWSPLHANAAEVDTASATLDLSYGFSNDQQTSMQGVVEITPRLEVIWNPQISLVTSARLRVDTEDQLEPGRVNVDTYASATRPLELGTTGTLELRDLFLERRTQNTVARFGKQQIVWGQLDGIKVLDVVNPQDFREFILDDFAESRIGLWSAYLDVSHGPWRTELALVADGTGHAIPERDAWFSLSAPRFRYGADPSSPGLPLITDNPSNGISDIGMGVRVSRQVRNLEFAVLGYSGIDPEPLGQLSTFNQQPVVERYYERRDTAGVSVNLGLGGSVLRAEYAYHPDRTFNTRQPGQLSTRSMDQQRFAVGLDMDGPLSTFINAQFLIDTVSDAPADLVRPDVDRVVTLYARRTFAYDAVTVAARWYHSLTEDDDLAAISVDYAVNDATNVRLEAQWFSGIDTGLFGQFSDRDRIVLALTHTF